MRHDMIRVVTRSGSEHVMNSADRYTVLLDDDSRRTVPACLLSVGDVLVGAGRILRVERMDTQGEA